MGKVEHWDRNRTINAIKKVRKVDHLHINRINVIIKVLKVWSVFEWMGVQAILGIANSNQIFGFKVECIKQNF